VIGKSELHFFQKTSGSLIHRIIAEILNVYHISKKSDIPWATSSKQWFATPVDIFTQQQAIWFCLLNINMLPRADEVISFSSPRHTRISIMLSNKVLRMLYYQTALPPLELWIMLIGLSWWTMFIIWTIYYLLPYHPSVSISKVFTVSSAAISSYMQIIPRCCYKKYAHGISGIYTIFPNSTSEWNMFQQFQNNQWRFPKNFYLLATTRARRAPGPTFASYILRYVASNFLQILSFAVIFVRVTRKFLAV
jgi:hypothetical protein